MAKMSALVRFRYEVESVKAPERSYSIMVTRARRIQSETVIRLKYDCASMSRLKMTKKLLFSVRCKSMQYA